MKLNYFKATILLYALFQPIFSNLIVNHDFSHNQLTYGEIQSFTSIQGWVCNTICQLHECHHFQNSENCSGNYMDIDSNGRYQSLIQYINIEQNGSYRLIVQYYNPKDVNNGNKTLLVYFDSQIISQVSTQLSYTSYLDVQIIDLQITVSAGIHNLTITMDRNVPDSSGFILKSISLTVIAIIPPQTIANITPQTTIDNVMDYAFNNSLTQIIIKIPGGRVVYPNYVMFLSNFDRLQLYIYHNRNYSQNYLALIKRVNEIQQLQLIFLKDTAKSINHNLVKLVDQLKDYFSFNKGKQNSIQIQTAQQRIEGFEDGFIENQLDYLVYKVAAMCIFFGVLKLLFHALYNYPISLIIRKYYYYDGSIEQLTFFLFMEIKMLSYQNFTNKLTNGFMVMAMYIVVLASVAIFMLLFSYYKKLIKYFQQNSKSKVKGVIADTIDRGIVCFLFGLAHRLFLRQPNVQLFVLIAIQVAWIISRLKFTRKRAYQSRILIFVWVFEGFLRIVLIISFYWYNNYEEFRQFINEFHGQLITSYIYLMGFEFLFNSFELLKEIFQTLRKIYRYHVEEKERISAQQKKQKEKEKKVHFIQPETQLSPKKCIKGRRGQNKKQKQQNKEEKIQAIINNALKKEIQLKSRKGQLNQQQQSELIKIRSLKQFISMLDRLQQLKDQKRRRQRNSKSPLKTEETPYPKKKQRRIKKSPILKKNLFDITQRYDENDQY